VNNLNKYLTQIEPQNSIDLSGLPFLQVRMVDTNVITHFLICRTHPTLMYIKSGITNIVISNQVYHLKKGDLIFINYFEYYKHLPIEGEKFELFFLTFDLTFLKMKDKDHSILNLHLKQLLEKILFFPRFLPDDSSCSEGIKKLYENICDEGYKDPKRTKKFINPFLVNVVSSLILNKYLKKDYLHKKRMEKIQLLDNIFNVLESSFFLDNCINVLEEATNISRRKISKLISHFYDLPLVKFINIYKIQKSMELFYKTTLTNTEIANKVGFNDQSYFDKIFKLVNEITPSQFREELSKFPSDTLPPEWKEICFGTLDLKGSSCYSDGVFKIKGPGNKLVIRNDVFHSVCKEFTSDFEFKCYSSLKYSSDIDNFTGILIRESLKDSSDFYSFLANKSDRLFFALKTHKKGYSHFGTAYIESDNVYFWIKKQGQKITVSKSENGTDWLEVFNKVNLFNSNSLYICLTTSSRNPDRLSMAEFRVLD